MSTLSEQLPWQLRQQPAEQVPDSTGEHASADDTTVSAEAEPGVTMPLLILAPASEAGSFAEQQQQRLELLGMSHEGGVFGTSSSTMADVGQGRKGDEEATARAAYRQWSESFEAGRVRAALQSGPACYILTHMHNTYLFKYGCVGVHVCCVWLHRVCAC